MKETDVKEIEKKKEFEKERQDGISDKGRRRF